jgi:hypothetical protein
MARIQARYLSVTTDGSGDGTATDTTPMFGYLYAVDLIDGSYDDGVDFTLQAINNPISGVTKNLLVIANFNTDQTLYPRTLMHGDTDGAALTGTAGGDRCMQIVNGTLKATIAQGGATKTGGCIVYIMIP